MGILKLVYMIGNKNEAPTFFSRRRRRHAFFDCDSARRRLLQIDTVRD